MIPTPPSIENSPELPSMVEKLKNGDKAAKEAIILGFMKISQQIAAAWARRTRRNVEILEAEAMYLLTLAVTNAQTRLKDNNIGPYINTYVSRNLLKFLYKNRMIPLSKEKMEKFKIANCPLFCWLNDLDQEKNDLLIDFKQLHEQEMAELLQTIEFCIQTNEERIVFSLRISGHSNEEIAGIMGISYQTVGRIRRELEKRFRKELGIDEKTRISVPNCLETLQGKSG